MNTAATKLPKDFFGQSESDAMQYLLNHLSIIVTGIPGFGKTFFAKHILNRISAEHPEILTYSVDINFLPDFTSPQFLPTIGERLGGKRSMDIHSLLEKITKEHRVIISLEGVSKNTDARILNFFHHLGTINHTCITFITTAHASVLEE